MIMCIQRLLGDMTKTFTSNVTLSFAAYGKPLMQTWNVWHAKEWVFMLGKLTLLRRSKKSSCGRKTLGEDTPQKLLDTVFYLNGICFCLRGGEEHHSLTTSSFSIITKGQAKHLKYQEGVTKTNNGVLSHKSLNMSCWSKLGQSCSMSC